MTRATVLYLFAVVFAGCGDDPKPTTPDAPIDDAVRVLPDEITSDMTLSTEKPYLLPKNTHVFVKNNATLTIPPGTEIRGEKGSVLVISRGSKIKAEGTLEKPIVFTSAQPVGMRTAGYWGGLLVLGKAHVNVNANSNPPAPDALFEAFSNADGDAGKFGGTDDADDSGTIKYVRIEFGGYNFVADREFNNLTLCGVGNKTVVDFVQVHGGADDGIELFGGTVNVKHIVSSQNQDDGFDTDNGWQGKAQFVIVQNISHPPTLPEATNGYESDNHGTDTSYTALPRTLPTVTNVTLIGDHGYTGAASFAAVFRRGTGGHYSNHIWFGFPKGPEIRDAETQQQITDGNLTVERSILFRNDATDSNMPVPQKDVPVDPKDPTGPQKHIDLDEATLFKVANGIVINVDPGLPDAALSKTAPDFKPKAGAIALTGGVPPSDPFFDQTATFIGAIGTVDWTTGWTSYPQN
jgi:hypothetical protein